MAATFPQNLYGRTCKMLTILWKKTTHYLYDIDLRDGRCRERQHSGFIVCFTVANEGNWWLLTGPARIRRSIYGGHFWVSEYSLLWIEVWNTAQIGCKKSSCYIFWAPFFVLFWWGSTSREDNSSVGTMIYQNTGLFSQVMPSKSHPKDIIYLKHLKTL